jgi:transcriptional regulator with XRE-family HTH domain
LKLVTGSCYFCSPMGPVELINIRNRFNLSQLQLAKLLGVERVTVARWEIGERKITSPMALAIEHVTTCQRSPVLRKKGKVYEVAKDDKPKGQKNLLKA